MTAAEPVFTRDGTTDLYWLDPADRITAFLSAHPASLGDTPSLTTTWGKDPKGVYAMLGAVAPSDFLARLQTWLDTYRPTAWPRFLWVANPADDPLSWVVTELTVQPGPNDTIVVDGANFAMADWLLVVRPGAPVAPGSTTDAGWGFELADAAGDPATTLYSPVDVMPSRPGSSVLAMSAGAAGAWRFALDRPAGSNAFAQLACGMRYFTPAPGGYVNAIHFGVVSQPAAKDLAFFAQLDPVRPTNGDRSHVGFFSWTGAGSPPPLPSGYATAYGHDVSLQPQATARLVFGFAPSYQGQETVGGLYLVPEGPFALTVTAAAGQGPRAGDGTDRLVCGTSGLEYLGLPASAGASVTFVPGQPAFAPLGTQTTGDDALTGPGTTAWVSVSSSASVGYFSQPEDAPLYQAPNPTAPDNALADNALDLLDFLELSAGGVGSTAFPMAPFRGLAPDAVANALAVEQLALAPRRRAALTQAALAALAAAADADADAEAEAEAAADAGEKIGVTPQGLAVGVAGSAWTWVGIGHTTDGAALPDLRFTKVGGHFKQALQTNNLFLVLGNAAEFDKAGSVAYCLTSKELGVIGTLPAGHGVDKTVLKQVTDKLKDVRKETRDLFVAALKEAAPTITDDEVKVFCAYGGLLTPIVGGWPFRLSPDNWGGGAMLLFKFVLGRSVADLVNDVSTWQWPEAASPDGPAAAQAALRAVIADAQAAVDAAHGGGPYKDFLEVVTGPDWTGVLALGVKVPLEQLPDELQVLAAGIDPGAFKAHHFGLSVTPYRVKDKALWFERTSMFGLIDYRNPEDQYFSDNIPFAFRVLQLTVGLRNSVVTTFASRVELLVNRLFGAPSRLFPTTHGNNIILDGALQRQRLPDGSEHDTYVFSMSGQNLFRLNGLVLQSVELLATQLVTAKASDPATGDPTVEAVFQLAGNLRFYEHEGFDPFSWGPAADGTDGWLRFGNLGIAMSFALGDPAGTTVFHLKDGNLSFDMANSQARPDALVSRFPIRLASLIATADPALSAGGKDKAPPPQSPADMGFVSATAPLDQSALDQPWYGLNYSIDLGTLGALAGSTAIALGVLVAWSPGGKGGTEPAVYVGVKLPGAKDALGVSLPLQGVIKAGFKGIEFLVDNQAGRPRVYTLRMRDFALRLLGLAFPPGHNDVILFGNPDQAGSSKAGWYLAYASDADPKRPPPPPTRQSVQRLQAAARPSPEA